MAMAESFNGLDPDVWGQLAQWDIAHPRGRPSELAEALELLARAQVLLNDLASGEEVSPARAAFLHDDLVAAAVCYQWWIDDGAEA